MTTPITEAEAADADLPRQVAYWKARCFAAEQQLQKSQDRLQAEALRASWTQENRRLDSENERLRSGGW